MGRLVGTGGRGKALACALVVLALASCRTAAHPVRPTHPRPASPALKQLQTDIDAILANPVLEHGYWGVLVQSLANSETLYDRNARRLMMPASNMKVVTLAAAVEQLGWDFTYETKVHAAGPIAGGRLDGDLVIVGSGDPSIGLADGMSERLFADWAARLKAAGIRTIAGRIVGDDNAFDDEGLGFGWSWDDLPDDYAAGVSALQFNENAVRITVTPGAAAGDSAGVAITPPTSAFEVDSTVTTTAAGTPSAITARRLPGRARLELRGSIPAGNAAVTRVASVDNPTLFFVSVLRHALIAQGIDVRGAAVDIDDAGDVKLPAGTAPLIQHRSPPLSVLAVRLMKISQNLYAETLLKTLGAAQGVATYPAGRTAARAALERWGLTNGDLIERDGSGLSRYNMVSPSALVKLMTHAARDEKLKTPFEAALPIAGRDGTLGSRMKGTPAEGNARAKTGSMANVRTLSGYVTAADGERLVFAIMANNFETGADVILRAIDAIVVRLATFKR